MSDRLHPFLLALTLLDLAFVHATGAVPDLSMLPLWLLAAASPWLRRLQRFRAYSMGWNGGVLIVFALLVHHATTTGLLHMLEDGLILAVLCQVHLLNNVGNRQRPDLTFFNSLLIVFVTSFFAPDLWWSALFVAHGFVLVPGLQIYVMARRNPVIDGRLVRALLRDSAPRTCAIGAVTVAVFVLWPRDFHRSGWLGDALQFGQQLQAGLTERIEFERQSKAQLSDEVVARLEPVSTSAQDIPMSEIPMSEIPMSEIPMYWRGIAFSEFDGRTWYPQDAAQLGSRFATDVQWQQQRDRSWLRPGGAPAGTSVRVRYLDAAARQLLTPLGATRLRVESATGRVLDPKSYGGFAVLRADDVPPTPLVYIVDVAAAAPTIELSARTRAHFTRLPESGVPKLAYDLGQQIRDALPAEADDLAIATAACDWLQQNRRYQLPGEPGFARNLGEFLLGTAAGHCEYFATTLALLLRTQGVPCRLVGGYLAHERHPGETSVTVRARDAHAWVEVLSLDDAWHTFDATPPADLLRDAVAGQGWWGGVIADLDELWAAVTNFDANSRDRWLSALLSLPLRRPVTFVLLVALIAVLCWQRRRRQRQRLPTIVAFERALQAARLSLQPGETPRELVARATAGDIEPNVLAAIHTAARDHERLRYGNQVDGTRPERTGRRH